jgi:hypothetical protein
VHTDRTGGQKYKIVVSYQVGEDVDMERRVVYSMCMSLSHVQPFAKHFQLPFFLGRRVAPFFILPVSCGIARASFLRKNLQLQLSSTGTVLP